MTRRLPFRLRALRAQDLPTIIYLERLIFDEPWPERMFVQELYTNPHAHYSVLELTDPALSRPRSTRRGAADAKILGYVGLRVERKEGHISTLAVRPTWQGRGLGELLLTSALRRAYENRAERVALEVRATNDVARALYKKYEFDDIARLQGYYGDGDGYRMRLAPLDAAYAVRLRERRAALITRLREEFGTSET
jgi:[ribosomal protein S18]-alanine N-acetyltransferase